MEKIHLLIADDSADIRASLGDFLAHQSSIALMGEAADGIQALQIINQRPIDVIVLDLIMPTLDGFGVLERLRQITPAQRPKAIVLTALARDDFVRQALQLGAAHYLVKPADPKMLLSRIEEVATGTFAKPPAALHMSSSQYSLDERISNIFLGLGIPANIKGYRYLCEAVKLVIEDPERINRLTKELYPTIARHFDSNASQVERAMRHAVEVGWNRGRVDSLNRAFGCRVALPEDKPTNGELIALIAGKLGRGQQKTK